MVLDRAVTSWADEARRIWLDVKDRKSDRIESAVWSNANSLNRLSYLMGSLMLRLSVLTFVAWGLPTPRVPLISPKVGDAAERDGRPAARTRVAELLKLRQQQR